MNSLRKSTEGAKRILDSDIKLDEGRLKDASKKREDSSKLGNKIDTLEAELYKNIERSLKSSKDYYKSSEDSIDSNENNKDDSDNKEIFKIKNNIQRYVDNLKENETNATS